MVILRYFKWSSVCIWYYHDLHLRTLRSGQFGSRWSPRKGVHHPPQEYNNSGITWIGSQHSQLQTFSFCLVNKCVEVLVWWFSICLDGLEWSVWQGNSPCFSNTSAWVEIAPKNKRVQSQKASYTHHAPAQSSARKGRRQYAAISRFLVMKPHPFLAGNIRSLVSSWLKPSHQPACHKGWLSCSCLFMKSFGLIYS